MLTANDINALRSQILELRMKRTHLELWRLELGQRHGNEAVEPIGHDMSAALDHLSNAIGHLTTWLDTETERDSKEASNG